MESDEAKRVLRGQLTKLPALPSKTVRIFLSSTFTDMGAERNALMTNVYPKLNKYCREKHGLDFQVVDMRWGVRDESSDDHSTTALCLEEIKQCQRCVGPNFVALMGQRYGTVTAPATILASEFQVLLEMTTSSRAEDAQLLKQWYLLDENAMEPVYFLQPKTRYPDADWKVVEGKLLRAIQCAAETARSSGTLADREAAQYFCSVTEKEVQHGLLDLDCPEDRCLCFNRIIHDLDERHEKAWRFTDLKDGLPDLDSRIRLQKLRDTQIPQKLAASNIFSYDVTWSANGGVNEVEHAKYLEQFCRDFEEAVIRLIDRAGEKQSHSDLDEVYAECLEHAHACVAKCSQFLGREDALQTIKDYLLTPSRQPLVICGASGCGKTSVMAKTAAMVPLWLSDHSNNIVTILRFLGTTPSSSTITDVLSSICKQIIRAVPLRDDLLLSVPNSMDDLKEFFHLLLQMVAANRDAVSGEARLVLLLDSIDQLVLSHDVLRMKWLPKQLPINVKLIFSVFNGNKKLTKAIKAAKIDPSHFVQITPLKPEDSKYILQYWLDKKQRRITEKQWKAVQEAFTQTTAPREEQKPTAAYQFKYTDQTPRSDAEKDGCMPLYIKLVFDTIIQWRSYSAVPSLPGTIVDMIKQLFERLETKHGRVLVSYSLLCLMRAKHGLSDAELEDILSLQEEVLTDVFQYHVPPIRRLPSILWRRIRHDIKEYLVTRVADGTNIMAWYHRQFREVCGEKYNPKPAFVKHKLIEEGLLLEMRPDTTILEYFTGQWSDVEKPFQYSERQMKKLQLSEADSAALRFVPQQPTVFEKREEGGMMVYRFNGRKLTEMTHVIEQHELLDDGDKMALCMNLVLSDFEVIFGMLKLKRTEELLSLLDNIAEYRIDEEADEIEKREFWLMSRAISSSFVFLKEHPKSLGPLMTSQLVPFYNLLPHCTALINHIESVGLEQCALVTPHQQHEDAGGTVWYNISNHLGPVNDFVVVGTFLYSISGKIIGAEMRQSEELHLDLQPREIPVGECMLFLAHLTSFDARRSLWGSIEKSDITLYASLSKTPKVLVIDPAQSTVLETIDLEKHQTAESPIAGMRAVELEKQDFLLLWWKQNPLDKTSQEYEVGVYSPKAASLLRVYAVPCRLLSVIHIPRATTVGFLLSNNTVQWFRLPLSSQESEGNQWHSSQSETPLPLESGVIACHDISENERYQDNEADVALGTDSGAVFCITLNCDGDIRSLVHHQLAISFAHQVSLSVLTSGRKRLILTVCTDSETLFFEGRESEPSDLNLVPLCTIRRRFDIVTCQMGESDQHIVTAFSGGIADILLLGDDNEDESVKTHDGPVKARKLAVIDLHKGPVVKCVTNDELIYSCSQDGTAKVLNVRLIAYNVNHLKTFDHMDGVIGTIHTSNAFALCFSQDMKCAAVWDVINGHMQLPLDLEDQTVLAGAISSNDQYVAVAVTDRVKVWQIPTLKAEDASAPMFEVKLLDKNWTPWLFGHEDHISAVTRQGTYCIIDPQSRRMTSRELVTHCTPLEDVQLNNDKILILGKGRTSLYIFQAATGTLMKTFSLNKQHASLARFGSKIQDSRFWHDDLVLIIGQHMLFWNESAQSVVPIMNWTESSNLVDGDPGSQIAAFDERTGSLMAFGSIKSPKLQYDITGKSDMLYVTSNAKYLIQVNCRCVKLINLHNKKTLADYCMDVDILALGITKNENFILLATADRRLYSYLIVDPQEPAHRERIKALVSRNQRNVMTDRLEIIRDPRYKQVRALTYVLETSSFQESKELHFSTDSDADFSSCGEEAEGDNAKVGPRMTASNSSVLPLMQQQCITYPPHQLQDSTKHRLMKIQSDRLGKTASPKGQRGATWMGQEAARCNRTPKNTFNKKESRACRLM